jgi:hypothetical protein
MTVVPASAEPCGSELRLANVGFWLGAASTTTAMIDWFCMLLSLVMVRVTLKLLPVRKRYLKRYKDNDDGQSRKLINIEEMSRLINPRWISEIER